jgi:geranylgeranyl reductase family protein
VNTYDAIVAGAGPAGSTAARLLAQRGARVLLLDRARFPRDKPCGGGVTLAAARELALDLCPVVERTVNKVQVSLRMGSSFTRSSPEPLCYMTQRCRLDAYLAEQAVAAGADFRDGLAVREMDIEDRGVVVHADPSTALRAGGDAYRARALVGADGANGIVAKAAGLRPTADAAVALEGNIPASDELIERWGKSIAIDLGGTPGGYAWLFPKGDHLNIGVGGWRWIGPTLRDRLAKLCRYLELDESKLFGLRGYYLPLRARGAPLVRGPVLLAGDAAGFVDPLSGEGIHGAFWSGRLAAESIERCLSGEAPDLLGYERAVREQIEPELAMSTKLQSIFQRVPGPCIALMRRSDRFWGALVGFVRGTNSYSTLRRRIGPLAWAIDGAAAVAGTKRR